MLNKSKIIRKKAKSLSLTLTKSAEKSSYDKDFYNWTYEQVNLLKRKEYSKLDTEHLIEEIESLGRSEKRALESRFVVLLKHLLKVAHQPSLRSPSWESSIKVSRHHIKKLIKENPSLKPQLPKILEDAYFTARLEAISETGLAEKTFPKKCPWKVDECVD